MLLLGRSKVELFSDFEGNEEPELGVYSLKLKHGKRSFFINHETCEKCSNVLGGFGSKLFCEMH